MTTLYVLLYVKPITEETRVIYTSFDVDEALNYSANVYPGTVVVALTVQPQGG